MTLVELTPHAQITPTGVDFNEEITLDEWTNIGERLEQHDRSLRWVIGDWLLYGTERFGARANIVAEALNMASGTIANAASVCRRVTPEIRRADLSFGHHEEIAHFKDPDEQSRLLELAAQEGLSVMVLRALIRSEERERTDGRDTTAREEPTDESSSADDAPPVPSPIAVQTWPRSVTLRLQGDRPDERLLEDGLERVSEALQALLATHGFRVEVEIT